MKNMIAKAPKTIILSMLLAAGLAHAEGTGFDVSGVQAVIIAAVAALTGFVAAVGLSKAGLNAVVWGWRKIQSLAGSK
ncbi:hypothetical protein [Aeromonas jandaei]|uniref:hypothetical protein n=1 Tax=Aeromonas jandaei TaxID=650 RepID=UPI003BA01964